MRRLQAGAVGTGWAGLRCPPGRGLQAPADPEPRLLLFWVVLMREAWPCHLCNLGFDRVWVAGAWPALPRITGPHVVSLFLLERSGSLRLAAGRDGANALGLEIVPNLPFWFS